MEYWLVRTIYPSEYRLNSESEEQEARRLVACFYQEVSGDCMLSLSSGVRLGIGDRGYRRFVALRYITSRCYLVREC